MQFRGGHYVNYNNAEFSSFEEAQEAEDHFAELESEHAAWDDKRARVAAHNINNQIADSQKKNREMVEHPKGVVVLIAGLNQSIMEEDGNGGQRNNTDIDKQANTLRAAGYDVIAVNGDDVARAGLSTHFSQSAIGAIADAVESSVAAAGGNVPIDIEGFSRGTGAAIGLTNELTENRGVRGGAISTYLVDPFVGSNNNTIRSRDVNARVYHSTLPSATTMGAPLLGFGRNVYQVGRGRENQVPLFGPSYSVFHGQMDSYRNGVLGFVDDHILGRW